MYSVLSNSIKNTVAVLKKIQKFSDKFTWNLGLGRGRKRLVFLFLDFKINMPKKKKRRERTRITNIRTERGSITVDPVDTKRIIERYCEQLYATKLIRYMK